MQSYSEKDCIFVGHLIFSRSYFGRALAISIFLQIVGLQPQILNVILDHYNNFFLQMARTILETKYHCCKSYKLKSLFANLRLFLLPCSDAC